MAVNERARDEIVFEVVEHIGVISTYPTGWSKQLNLVSWNGGTPKVDCRDWDPEMERMSRGITLHTEEAQKLYELLGSMEINRAPVKEQMAKAADEAKRNNASLLPKEKAVKKLEAGRE